ncbi:MAG: hypothetical protein WB973_16470 [Thermoanaerobaculia bacterium]
MLELAITPSILRGKRQAPPDAMLKRPVELMPQVDSIPAIGHSGAVCADETDTKPGATRTTTNAMALDTRMKNPSITIINRQCISLSGRYVDLDQGGPSQKLTSKADVKADIKSRHGSPYWR